MHVNNNSSLSAQIIRNIDLRVIRNGTTIDDLDTTSWAKAFLDDFSVDPNRCVYNRYVVIRRCNALANTSINCLHVENKHLAVIFYLDNEPVRLLIAPEGPDFHSIQTIILDRQKGILPQTSYARLRSALLHLPRQIICQRRHPIQNEDTYSNKNPEIHLVSSSTLPDRPATANRLFLESCPDFPLGKYILSPNILFSYTLEADGYRFEIHHTGCYHNDPKMSHFFAFQDCLDQQLPDNLTPTIVLA